MRYALLFLGGCSFFEPSVGPLVTAETDATSAMDIDSSITDAGTTTMMDAPLIDTEQPVSFKRDIRPLMNRSADDPNGHGCKACHYSTEPQHMCTDLTNLDLATLGALRKGGKRTQDIVVPGKPADSSLVKKLRGTFDGGLRMPRNGPPYWSEQDIQLVERWIAEGAKGDDSE